MRFKKIFWQPKYTAIFFEIFSTEFSQIFLKNLEFTFFHLSKFYKGVGIMNLYTAHIQSDDNEHFFLVVAKDEKEAREKAEQKFKVKTKGIERILSVKVQINEYVDNYKITIE